MTRFYPHRSIWRTATLFALLLLMACSLPGQGAPPRQYVLTPKSTYDDDLPTVDWQLLIETPVSKAGLNSPRIALRHSVIQFDYFANTAWMDTGPRMVQNLLVESFENSGSIISIGRQAIGLKSDFQLKLELRHFQAEYQGPKPQFGAKAKPTNEVPKINVSIIAKLIKMPQREIVAAERFDSLITAAGPDMLAIVAAFDEALGKVMKRLVTWTILQGQLNMAA